MPDTDASDKRTEARPATSGGPSVADAITMAKEVRERALAGNDAVMAEDEPSLAEGFIGRHRVLRPDLDPVPRQTKLLFLAGSATLVAVILFAALYTAHIRSAQVGSGAVTYATPAQLAGGVLRSDDVGPGWFRAPSPGRLDAATVASGPCSSPLWSNDIAAFESAFIRGGGDYRNGEVISRIFEAKTVGDAQAQQSFVGSKEFVPCLKRQADTDLHRLLGPGVQITKLDITVDPFDPGFAVPAQGNAITMVVDTVQLGQLTIANDDVEVFDGPYEGVLSLSSCTCAPLDRETLRTDVSRMALRIATLPGASSLMTPF